MTISFFPPPPLAAAELVAAEVAALVVAALDVAAAAGALELDVDCELLLEPQPIATMLRAQTTMAGRASDRTLLLRFMFSPSATVGSRRFK
jgi:hypothetical protein